MNQTGSSYKIIHFYVDAKTIVKDKEAINLERSWEGAGKGRSDAVIVLMKF